MPKCSRSLFELCCFSQHFSPIPLHNKILQIAKVGNGKFFQPNLSILEYRRKRHAHTVVEQKKQFCCWFFEFSTSTWRQPNMYVHLGLFITNEIYQNGILFIYHPQIFPKFSMYLHIWYDFSFQRWKRKLVGSTCVRYLRMSRSNEQ
jgi:hypothetical protein